MKLNQKKINLFMLARVVDILSTRLSYKTPADEMSPVARMMMVTFGFWGWAFLNLMISFIFGLFLIKIKRPIVITVVTILSILVALFNTVIFYYFNYLY